MVSVLVSVADSYATKPLPLKRFGMEAEVGIEPSFRRIPFYSSAYLCFTRGKLALVGFMGYIELHSNEWQKRNY